MKIFLTGGTGYVGKRLLPVLLQQGHEVIVSVRDKSRFSLKKEEQNKVEVVEMDFLQSIPIADAPTDFDVAFYLIHSMTASIGDFEEKEATAAQNFIDYIDQTSARQIIYLTGIVQDEEKLSKHLKSRFHVEHILSSGSVPLTALRAGIIIGSGSASFEIIRDLVEKLPVMVAPQWLKSKCQPISISNVVEFLTGVMGQAKYFNQAYDIGTKEILTYQQMLEQYAEVRKFKRFIFTVPIMTPRLSSYWLYFITSTSYNLAVNLVDSMKVDVLCEPNNLSEELGIRLIPYKEAISRAFSNIEQNEVISSWKDSYVSSLEKKSLHEYIAVPTHGCFVDKRKRPIQHNSEAQVMDNIWSIGGQRGWYYAGWLWKIRGYLDKLVGGIGLRRGRTNGNKLQAGDALDFWRVLLADRENKRLLLFAEMKLPGEAWLEFKIETIGTQAVIVQTATYRPKGILGRLYWYAVLPFHFFVFEGMLRNVERFKRG